MSYADPRPEEVATRCRAFLLKSAKRYFADWKDEYGAPFFRETKISADDDGRVVVETGDPWLEGGRLRILQTVCGHAAAMVAGFGRARLEIFHEGCTLHVRASATLEGGEPLELDVRLESGCDKLDWRLMLQQVLRDMN